MFQLRRRRPELSIRHSTSVDSLYRLQKREEQISTAWVFAVLVAVRIISAALNIVHDCDEVFNYWEPLHFLLYGYGMQTWEYSSQYALRSYWYLLLHSPVAAISAHFAGPEGGKAAVFYITKAFLGVLSAATETALVRATREYAGPSTSNKLLLLLLFSCGMFTSSTSLLPSSFAMYMVTWAAASVLSQRTSQLVFAAVACVLWGWPVTGIALIPYALYVLLSRRLLRSVTITAGAVLVSLLPLVIADRLFYGEWTVSIWNFVRYNVIGGGDSALYGTESATYYLRNGLLNLNVVLPLAFSAPAWLTVWGYIKGDVKWRLLVAISPVWVWTLAITALPHKEERFLYVVYPLMCLAAAAVLTSLRQIIFKAAAKVLSRNVSGGLAFWGSNLVVWTFVVLSLSRAALLVTSYGAPMSIYSALPKIPQSKQELKYVCVGAEWHRFPSSFFLPSPLYRLAFVESGFGGLLPRQFSFEEGGTASSSAHLNDRNEQDPANFWSDLSRCDFLVTLAGTDSIPSSGWRIIAEQPFMLAEKSRSLLARVLYIPWYYKLKNKFAQYQLYQKHAVLDLSMT